MSSVLLVALAACGDDAVHDVVDAPTGGDADAGEMQPLPPGSWAEAGLDAVAGARDDLACASAGLSGQRYLYVDVAAPDGGDGSRAAPLHSVAEAVALVGAGQKAVVCIAEGVYEGAIGSDDDVFSDGRAVVLVGGYRAGFTIRDAVGARTHLRGPGDSAATLTFGNVRAFTLDGLEISNGARGVAVEGGYSAGREVTIRNCHVHHNGIDDGSDHEGGGLRISGSSILIEHVVVEDNRAGRLGGGVFIGATSSGEQNRLDAGGELVIGTSLARVRSSIVRRNTLHYDTPHGVGLALGMNSEIIGNVITDNHGQGVPGGGEAVGGGLIVQMPLATALIADNWIARNIATKYGAGVFIDEASVATIVNNVLVDNDGEAQIGIDGRAGGDAVGDRSYATVINVTIVGGTGPALAAQDATLRVYNTLCDGTPAAAIASRGGGALGEDIVIDGSRCAGSTGDGDAVEFGAQPIECDPSFIDPTGEDLRLGQSSTCAGRGLTDVTPARAHAGAWTMSPTTDAMGVARPRPPAIGALERLP